MTISIVVFDSSMQVLIQCLSSLFYAISYFRACNGKDSKVIIYIVKMAKQAYQDISETRAYLGNLKRLIAH